jgi:signal transduction histidine kinase
MYTGLSPVEISGVTVFAPKDASTRSDDVSQLSLTASNVLLTLDQKWIRFQFKPKDDSSSGMLYRLRGYDGAWTNTSATPQSVTYHHLPAGSYTFEVLALPEGAHRPVSFSVTVPQSAWLSPTALAAYGFLGMLMFLMLPIRMLGRMREREIANAKLRDSENRVRVVLSSAGCELWHFYVQDRTLEREGALSHLLNLPAHTRLPADTIFETMHPEDRSHFEQSIGAHVQGQTEAFDCAYRLQTRDGGYAWVRSVGRAEARDGLGRVSIISGTTVDISDFKKKETELATLNANLSIQIFELEQAREKLSTTEKRRKLALWGAGCEFFEAYLDAERLERENLIDDLMANEKANDLRAYWEFLHPDDTQAFSDAFLHHVKGRSEFYDVTYRTKRNNGSWCWIQTRGRAVGWDHKGHATIIAGTNYDVSELKRVELALQESAEALEQRVSARTQDLSSALDELRAAQAQLVTQEKMAALGGLVAGVAHEINTPLGIGVTAASHMGELAKRLKLLLDTNQLKKSELLDFADQTQVAADLVSNNLRRASELVKSFKQVAVDQSSEEKRMIEIGSYLQDVLNSLRPNTKRFRHNISLRTQEIHIDSFPGAIYQVVSNLVLNALIHAFDAPFPPEQIGEIRIHALAVSSFLHLSVMDDGNGMNDATRKKVFEPFFTTKRGQGGSGLGLHIVYNLVTKVLNGSIELHSVLGEGTRFDIRIPIPPTVE